MRWRLILEEYSSELIIIQDSKNIATDTLNRLDIVDTPNPVKNNIKFDSVEDISHPTNYKTIMQNQQKNKEFIKIA